MTEAEFQNLQQSNNQAVASGKAPLIEVAEPEKLLDNPKQNPEGSAIDEFLPTLIPLRKMRLAKIATKTLVAAGASFSVGFTPRKFLTLRIKIKGKAANTPTAIYFNGDGGNNYIYFITANNPSSAFIYIENSSNGNDFFSLVDIINLNTEPKFVAFRGVNWDGSAAGTLVQYNGIGGWANSVNQINNITVLSGGGANFGAGSFIDVYGHD